MALGDLVTRLTADTSGLAKGLSQGQSLVSKFTSGVTSSLGGVAGILAGGFATAGLAAGFAKTISAANTQIDAEKKLAAVLDATGLAADGTGKQLADYASELQAVSNFGDEVTLGAAAMLAGFENMNGGTIERTLGLSADVATIFGQQLPEAARKLGNALSDPVAGMNSLADVGV